MHGLFQLRSGKYEVHPVKMNGRKADRSSFPPDTVFVTANESVDLLMVIMKNRGGELASNPEK